MIVQLVSQNGMIVQLHVNYIILVLRFPENHHLPTVNPGSFTEIQSHDEYWWVVSIRWEKTAQWKIRTAHLLKGICQSSFQVL